MTKFSDPYLSRNACVTAGGHAAYVDSASKYDSLKTFMTEVAHEGIDTRRITVHTSTPPWQHYASAQRSILIGAYLATVTPVTYRWLCSEDEINYLSYDGSLIKAVGVHYGSVHSVKRVAGRAAVDEQAVSVLHVGHGRPTRRQLHASA